ncbi:uncharacterized protein BDR25DRAFT_345541 [Lindgomyces ingoldianus]|uniref:Uncharacterized protein n=1 Tax=Lindgomyces ingoldianus TaxID=673940 RepID=A0ACB6QH40_9PLEO|nr:uncharacterized protein BDR25DRAFT_345541 [Lindgomyces ingoldianus]KAF2466293.1 hypothetical protein BDR25DRAFT_345541 [Lindgomyces ingoldianus]
MAASRWQRLIPFRKDRHDSAASSSKQQPSKVSALGLKVVAEGEQPVIDIVAVHGLNGHCDETWTAANGTHWLRDLLPKDIPDARIFCWGYDANTHGKRVSHQFLYDHAEQLVADLCLRRKRTNTMKRPIIFVAHSLGGIIVKGALIHSDAARKGALEEHRSIKTSTYGIIFMGTPHQGGNGVQFGKLLVNAASVYKATNSRLLEHLERDSEWLQLQLRQYGPISGEFMTKFAYEEYETPTALGHSIMVVLKASAVVPGAADAEQIMIHADHKEMVKFKSKEDNDYEKVSDYLIIMAESASSVISLRWEEEVRVDAARSNAEESYSVVFSLSEASETNHFVARQAELAAMHKALNEVSVKQSYLRLARRILQDCPSASQLGVFIDDKKQDKVVAAVKRWLEHPKNTQWLMVFDNYDNPKVPGNADPGAVDIRQFLPEAHHGSVIVTTRSSKVSMGRRVKVGKLEDVRDSLQILSDASHREDVIDDTTLTLLDPNAAELARELDGLPLALATAGAYLDQVATSSADYLCLYRESWRRLQQTSPELLQLWAYFDNQDLWFELLREGRTSGPQWLCQLTEDELSFNEAVRVLCDYGLIEVDKSPKGTVVESQGYGMHSCVHAWTVHVVNQEWDAEMAGVAMECVGRHVPADDVQHSSLTQRRLLRHLTRCWGFIIDGRMGENGKDWILHRFGYVCSSQGRFQEAEKMYLRALQGKEKAWGPDHTSTLSTVNNLGLLYADLGRFDEAEKMYSRALQGKEKAWGLDHTSTLETVNNLGNLYVDLGRLDEAEKMYLRALQGFKKAWGLDHTSTLETVNNLGNLYKSLGRLKEAEKMYLRALQGFEKAWGLDYTSTLSTVNNLGNLYADLGRLDEAEKMYLRVLQGYEKALGQEAVKTYIPALNTTQNMALLFQRTGRTQEAKRLYEQALLGVEAVFGRRSNRYRSVAKVLDALHSASKRDT